MAAAAAAGHCARVAVPSAAFEGGAVTYSRVSLVSYKCRVSSSSPPEPSAPMKKKKIRQLDRSIRCRDFALPRSSFRAQPCSQTSYVTDERRCSPDQLPFSTEKGCLTEQARDHQPPRRQGGAYPAGLSEKEIERRRKIGAANKGKPPWTKGRKLTKEHKQLIKQRTIEALRDPKVRMKMGHHQLHRQASKEKISAALRKIWERRIVSVKSRQMLLRIWSNSIAEAAKEGDNMQDKLDWDSYDKIKSEMISVFLWKKEKEQITKKLKRAVTKIIAKKLQAAEKMELQTRRTKKTKPEKLVLRKSVDQPRRVVASTRPKLKERLTKWHGRKKELEIVISSRVRKGGGPRKPAAVRRRAVERRAEVDLVTKPTILSGRPKELHSSCKDGLPCADT